MSFNLIRNSRMFFTTNVAAGTGVVNSTGFTAANTREIQILEGFSFSQNTASETVTLSEAGSSPVRGQRSFNTALEPVDFSFSTYIRPADTGANISAEESVLWNALLGTGPIGAAGAAWSDGIGNATVVATNSQAHQLQAFGVIIVIDGTSYIIDNCALDTATIDFGLDAIAMIAWAGKGTRLRQVSGLTATTGSPVILSGGGFTGADEARTALGKNTTAPYIANKLSTLSMQAGINGTGTSYTVALTGGSLSIANNLTYLTPSNLGVVNQPVTYFTGTRAISGSLTAYLRAGAQNTAGLMADLLASSTSDVDPAFAIQIEVGGSTSNTRIELDMPAAVLTIPSVSAEQVVSTTINFTAQSSNAGAFDIAAANELEVRYYTPNL
jgi:threonine dehydrogenase-like Zn-dependent dehydrogenase